MQRAETPEIPLFSAAWRQDWSMSDGDLTARPDTFDPGADQRQDRGSAAKIVNALVLILVLVALGVLAYGTARQFFPRWWAEQVVGVVDGSLLRGLALGFGVGLGFTLIPLLLLAQARRRFFNWTWRIILLVIAVILALPNWLTVAVALGTSHSAVDGRVLMTEAAPGFRNGSAGGAVVGVLLAIVLVGFSMRLSHRRRQVLQLKSKVRDLETRVAAPAEES